MNLCGTSDIVIDMTRSILLATICIFTTCNLASADQKIINHDPLKITATLANEKLPAGANTEIKIRLNLAEKHHAYLNQFRLKLVEPKNLQLSKFKISPTVKFKDKFTKEGNNSLPVGFREGIQGRSTMTAVLGVPLDYSKGTYPVTVEVTYQACTKDYCLFPKKATAQLRLIVQSSSSSFTKDKKSKTEKSEFLDAMKKGWLFTFIFVFLAGILTSLTPCIFPMIPITLAVLGANSKNTTWWKGLSLSVFYVLGIALTYSLLGVLAASTGALFGNYLSQPIVVSTIALVFVLLALSMYGAYEIKLPSFLANSLGKSRFKSGYLGAFLTGIVAGVVASPCVGPVLISILTFIAETQNLLFGFSLMFTFALGLGVLFLVLGASSQLVQKLPKAGPWMTSTKFIFGTTMIVMALYYLNPVVSESMFKGLVGIYLIILSSAYGAFSKVDETSIWARIKKGVLLLLFILGVGCIFSSLQIIHSPIGKKSTIQKNLPVFNEYSPQALRKAKENHLPVVIDFYADWCVACKELELLTFKDPLILSIADNYVWLRFDATLGNSDTVKTLKQFSILGLPTILFVDKNGEFKKDLTLTGFESAKKFKQRLEQL